jgi:DNA invertase Pin-like site-specific DNA recombinase
MTRVALYARYSSDNQRDASIEDQLRICREKAERENWTVVSTYKDANDVQRSNAKRMRHFRRLQSNFYEYEFRNTFS